MHGSVLLKPPIMAIKEMAITGIFFRKVSIKVVEVITCNFFKFLVSIVLTKVKLSFDCTMKSDKIW